MRSARVESTRQRSFGEALRRYRMAVGLSQQQLAERASLSPDAVSALERGVRRSPHQETVQLLARALDLSPDERVALEQTVGRGRRRPRLVRAVAPIGSSIPMPPNRLIGREEDLAAVVALLRSPEPRLLTLVGPPGIGKTRLALAAAGEVAAELSGAVSFVDLAPLRDPTLFGSTLVHSLGLEESGASSPVERLRDFFGDRTFLLVLDNFEQVVDAAPLVAELLEVAPALRVVATSRAPLSLRSEHLYAVPPLGLPDLSREPSPDDVARSSAVTLFIDRARAIKREATLTENNAREIAQICVHLEGVPLAIELAAARITLLSESAILTHLKRGIDLLSDGPRDLPDRHLALRDAIDWSYDLLSPAEQALFRRLAAAPAGCTVDAARVIGAIGDDEIRLLRTLAALMGQSLVYREEPEGAEPRFRMLETIREYALEQLRASGEEAETRRRFYDWLHALVEAAEPSWRSSERKAWFDRLESEHDNLRAALAWSLDVEPQLTLQLAVPLWRFWEAHGHLAEGRKWLETALAWSGQENSGLRAEALTAAGSLAWRRCDYPVAVAFHRESLAIYRALHDDQGVALALNNLGVQASEQGEIEQALQLLEESLAAARRADARDVEAMALCNLGILALNCRNFPRAQQRLEEAVSLCERIQNERFLAAALENLAEAVHFQGDLDRALELYRESLRQGVQIEVKTVVACCLEGIAAVCTARHLYAAAARLFGAAEALREVNGTPLPPSQRELCYDQSVAALRAGMDAAALRTEWAKGRRLDVDRVLSLAFDSD